jgi:hypothetical protein
VRGEKSEKNRNEKRREGETDETRSRIRALRDDPE